VIDLLDNIVWHSLAGRHAHLSAGENGARRYSAGFSPIIGFENPDDPSFASLARHCEPGERFYTDAWSRPCPDGWEIVMESTMFKMVWERAEPPPDDGQDALPLGGEHAAQALALAELTRPGPFGIRTIELGEYFGYFEGNRLVSMAGERFHAGNLREISGVCTHPDFQGRGMARRLMNRLIRLELERGQTPCLHVMSQNTAAHGLYERMGFRDYKESVVRVISRC
jgi:GNAT superfamily N-acetyltransferase